MVNRKRMLRITNNWALCLNKVIRMQKMKPQIIIIIIKKILGLLHRFYNDAPRCDIFIIIIIIAIIHYSSMFSSCSSILSPRYILCLTVYTLVLQIKSLFSLFSVKGIRTPRVMFYYRVGTVLLLKTRSSDWLLCFHSKHDTTHQRRMFIKKKREEMCHLCALGSWIRSK